MSTPGDEGHADADVDADADADAQTPPHAHADAQTQADAHAHAQTQADADTDAQTHAHAQTHADAHAQTHADADANTEPSGLVRSSAMVGLGTALSRMTGLVRVGALAYAVAASPLSDAYNLANNTPNIVYELILGGVLSATLVPVFVEHTEKRDDEATSAVVTTATAALLALTAIAVLAAPLIVKLYTWRLSAAEAEAQEAVAVPLLRLFLPQMVFYGLTAIGTALLNARRRFAAPAFAPILNNLVVSAMLIALPRVADGTPTLDQVRNDTGLLLLIGLGTTGGIVAMTLALAPAIRAAGWRLHWRPDWRHPAVKSVARLSGWTFGYVAANQIALFIILALANQGDGQASAYVYAFVFFQLPHGLIAVSIMTTFVPELSSAATREDWQSFRERFSLGLRLIGLLVLPAAAGYALLARPLVSALLDRGAFGDADSVLTADVLANFAIGLVGFSVYLFTLRAFYALKDTRTPFVLNVIENAINVVLGVVLVGHYGVQGLAFAFSAAYTIAAVLAVTTLRARIGHLDGRRLATTGAKVVVGTAVMAAVVLGITEVVDGPVPRIALAVPAGALTYSIAVVGLRAEDLRSVLAKRPK